MIQGRVVKQPGGVWPVGVDFTPRLGADEIASCVVTSRRQSDLVDSSGTFLTGPTSIAAGVVEKTVTTGLVGEIHVVQFKATTVVGRVLEEEVEVYVIEE